MIISYLNSIKQILLITGSLLLITYPSGYIFSYYFLPRELKKFTLIISPIIGSAIIVVFLTFADFFKVSVGAFTLPYLCLSIIVFLIFLKVKKEKFLFNDKFILILCIVLMIVLLAPLIKVGYFSIYGTTSDASTYSALGDYLVHRSSKDPIPYLTDRPYYSHVEAFINSGVRLGPMYFLASINRITGSKYSIDNYQVVSVLLYVLSVISVYIFCQEPLRFKPLTAFFGAFIYGINTLIIHGNIGGFLSQIMVLMLIPLAISFGILVLETRNYKSIVCYVVIISAIFAVYPEALFYPILLPLTIFIYKLFKKKECFRRTYLTLLVLVVSIFILSFPSIIRTVNVIKNQITDYKEFNTAQSRQQAGNIRYYTSQRELLGFGAHQHQKFDAEYGMKLNALLNACFIVSLLMIMFFVIRKKQYVLIFGFFIYLIFILFAFKLTFPYAFYKVMVLSVFLFCSALAGALNYFMNKRKTAVILIKAIASFLVGFMIVSYVTVSIDLLSYPSGMPTKDTIALIKNVSKYVPQNKVLVFYGEGTCMWVYYLLRDRKRIESKNLYPPFFYKKYKKFYKIKGNRKYFLYESKLYYTKQMNKKIAESLGRVIWRNDAYYLIFKNTKNKGKIKK